MERYFVYILYSKKINRYYIGCSSNPSRRLQYHILGKGGGKRAFTCKASDWELVWKKEFSDKTDAVTYESNLKKQKSRKVIEKLVLGD